MPQNPVVKEPVDQPRTPAKPSSGLYNFASEVTVQYGAHTLTFRDGCGYALHPQLLAFLLANGFTPTLA